MTRTTKKKKEKEKSAYLLQSKNTSKSAPANLNQGMALFWSLSLRKVPSFWCNLVVLSLMQESKGSMATRSTCDEF